VEGPNNGSLVAYGSGEHIIKIVHCRILCGKPATMILFAVRHTDLYGEPGREELSEAAGH
jgi:hypothetical protein